MHIIVLGAGVVGVTSAWFLNQAGFEVTVIDRRSEAGRETSYANGGQISVCHAEPWAHLKTISKIIAWLGDEDAPLVFRLQLDWIQWRWGLCFLRECLPSRVERNLKNLVRLGLYSRKVLQTLRADTGITYDELTRGILHYYTEEAAFSAAISAAATVCEMGLDREVKTSAECISIEPALSQSRRPIVGGTYTKSDESGDAALFTRHLAALCVRQGVHFQFNTHIEQLLSDGDRIKGVLIRQEGDDQVHTLTADAYLVCMGSNSPLLVRPLNLHLNIYPVKGYSATIPVETIHHAPTVSLTDDAYKIVFSRLGDRLRVAGTAEFNGYNLDPNPLRCQKMLERARAIFPNGGDYARAEFWEGLRPFTPNNLAYIGKTKKWDNLWLNTGHGPLGWTQACGAGQAIADLMVGKIPEVDFPFLGSR